VRPTPDAMRERAFAVLGERVVGARCLDLFAGTGAVGLEALSRGAASVVFVERHAATAKILRANCESFELVADHAAILIRPAADGVADLARSGQRFDLAWADPPFESWQEGLDVLVSVFTTGLLGAGALACFECPEKADVEAAMPGELEITRDLKGGASRVVMMKRAVVSRSNVTR
jgi:16S rRNA (guanine966-N2)-methyltransferase